MSSDLIQLFITSHTFKIRYYIYTQDSDETRNIINNPIHRDVANNLRDYLFELLSETNGSSLPLRPERGSWFPRRRRKGVKSADFLKCSFRLHNIERSLVQVSMLLADVVGKLQDVGPLERVLTV